MTIRPLQTGAGVASPLPAACPGTSALAVQDPAILHAAGDLDLATAGRFRGELTERIGRGHLHLVVDLSEVTFIDSTGLGALVTAHRTLQRRGGTLRLVCRRPRVLRVLSLTGLDTVLTVHGDLTEAVTASTAETVQLIGLASASSAAPTSTATDNS